MSDDATVVLRLTRETAINLRAMYEEDRDMIGLYGDQPVLLAALKAALSAPAAPAADAGTGEPE